ncbi:MAG: hypothetical protein ABI162_04410 [Luteolibacter sp.]
MKYRQWIKVLSWTLLVATLGAFVHFCLPRDLDRFGSYGMRRIARKLHIPVPAHKPLTSAEHSAARAEAAAWKVKFLAEFPALEVTERPVPAEENGFLLLYQLGSALPISEEFKKILADRNGWDPETVKRCLAEHAEVVGKIEHIAALPTRSSANMPADYIGFINAIPGINGSRMLLLKARLAAEAGDEEETLRLLSAAGNLGFHYHDIEAPSFLCETIAVLVNRAIEDLSFKTLLPALGKSAHLNRWKSLFGRKIYSAAELAKMMRGEWNNGADFMAFPLLAVSEKTCEMPDAEETLRCYSAIYSQCVSDLPSRSLADLMNYKIVCPGGVSHLSEEGRGIIDTISTGDESWFQGYVQAAAVHQQHQAALDLLILEKAGTTLTPADANRITREPVSGLPFVFDAVSRKLSAPKLDPLTLPW